MQRLSKCRISAEKSSFGTVILWSGDTVMLVGVVLFSLFSAYCVPSYRIHIATEEFLKATSNLGKDDVEMCKSSTLL